MSDYKRPCTGKKSCPSFSIIACDCGGQVTFLCGNCVVEHTSEPHPHTFLSLDSACQLSQNPVAEITGEMHEQYDTIEQDFKKYIQRLKLFRTKILGLRRKALEEVEAKVRSSLQSIDCLVGNAIFKLNEFYDRTADMTRKDSDILERYHTRGISGLMNRFAFKLSLKERAIKKAVRTMINIETFSGLEIVTGDVGTFLSSAQAITPSTRSTEGFYQPSFQSDYPNSPRACSDLSLPSVSELFQEFDLLAHPHPDFLDFHEYETPEQEVRQTTSSLFATKNLTRDLLRYDADSNRMLSYNLGDSISQNFYNSSSCQLPDFTILITGGRWYNNYHGKTYKVDVSTSPPSCIELGGLNFPREKGRLICHGNTVYFIGGVSDRSVPSRKAEKMILSEGSWIEISDMNVARYDFGVYIERDRVYLLGGRDNCSVEYLDIYSSRFYLLQNIEIPSSGLVCGVIGHEIYAVSGERIFEISKDFSEIKYIRKIMEAGPECYSDVMVIGGKILYINSQISSICSVEIETGDAARLKEF